MARGRGLEHRDDPSWQGVEWGAKQKQGGGDEKIAHDDGEVLRHTVLSSARKRFSLGDQVCTTDVQERYLCRWRRVYYCLHGGWRYPDLPSDSKDGFKSRL